MSLRQCCTPSVMTPMVNINPSSPILVDVSTNTSFNLTCMAMGGPRLVLTWEKDDMTLMNGTMGSDTLVYNVMLSSSNGNDVLGNYTCRSTIDDMSITDSVLVVGMYAVYHELR